MLRVLVSGGAAELLRGAWVVDLWMSERVPLSAVVLDSGLLEDVLELVRLPAAVQWWAALLAVERWAVRLGAPCASVTTDAAPDRGQGVGVMMTWVRDAVPSAEWAHWQKIAARAAAEDLGVELD